MNIFLTTAETAELLRQSVETVRKMAAEGQIPATKIGDDWLFSRDTLIIALSTRMITEQFDRKHQPPPQKSGKRGRPRANNASA